jgi:hypothetical protein
MPPIYTIALWMIRGFILILLGCAFWFCYRPYNPRYMRSFPLYCLVNLLSEIIAYLFPAQMGLIYNLFNGFELVYFAYFLTRVIDSRRVKRLVWLLIPLGFLVIYLVQADFQKVSAVSILLESVILMIPGLTYFHEIFLTKWVGNLLREPSFWMVTGIVFYIFLQIPIIMFTAYFSYHDGVAVGSEVYAIHNYVLIITYILFIKAMTCKRKRSY